MLERVSALGFGLGAATAAAAGSVYGLLYPFNSGSHYDLISRLLSIVLLGGLGQHRRERSSGAVDRVDVLRSGGPTISPQWSEMTFFVILIAVLLRPPPGAVRKRRAGRDMRAVGPARGGAFFAALVAAPFFGLEHWVLNMLIFTLMFATMASAWNLVGGFGGYPSLGHAAFFGIGAYALGLIVKGDHLTTGYEPFLWLPVVGVIGALVAWPIALVSMRTRADVFAIVTITLLFVTQTLAFNMRGLTGGAQGLALPIPPFPAATFERPYYFVLVVLLAVAMGLTWLVMHSKFGLSLVSVRADEDKARGIGVHVTGRQGARLLRERRNRRRWSAGSGPTTRASSTRSSPSTR